MPDNVADQTGTEGQQSPSSPQAGQQPGQSPSGSQTPPAQQQNGQPGQSQAPAPGQSRGDDPQNRGILADLQKERRARQALEQQIQQLNGQLTAEQRRVMALAGVTPQSPEEQELDTVRQRIVQLFPVLGKLTDEALDNLMGLQEQAGAIEQTAQHHWQTHGRQMLDSVQKAVAEEIGGELTDRQKKALARAYVAEAEVNPEFLQRHEHGDPTLIAEFAKQWVEDWFEPARKTVVAQEAARFRRVPNGRDRTVQTTPPKKVDFKDPKAVEDAMVESFRSHGGRFDN